MAEVIKGSTLGASPTSANAPRVSPFNFTDMSLKADDYLQQVRNKAAEIIAQAKVEAQQIADQMKAKAQQEGKQAALQAAEATLRKQVEAQLNRVLPALESAAEQLVTANAAWQESWNNQLLKISTAIASRVIRREVQQDAGITLHWIREALELGMGSPALNVHLHPDDIAVLKDRVQEISTRLTKLGAVRVVADSTVTRGGCRVQSDYGVIDQTIEAQLQRIEQELN
jgi:flagellar assembly protein FliH